MAQLCSHAVSTASCRRNNLASTLPNNGGPRAYSARTSCGASIRCSGANSAGSSEKCETSPKPQVPETITRLACGFCAALTVASALPSFAANTARPRLPPLSTDPGRCERAYDGNTIGQANGVSNITLDLRFCDYSNDVTNLKGKTLSSALMTAAKFDGADMTDVVMSKAYAVGASFKGTNFTNAVVDRVAFDKSDMRGVKFINTVLSGSTFDGADLTDASFEDALIGYVDIKNLCRNDTLSDTNREELGCRVALRKSVCVLSAFTLEEPAEVCDSPANDIAPVHMVRVCGLQKAPTLQPQLEMLCFVYHFEILNLYCTRFVAFDGPHG